MKLLRLQRPGAALVGLLLCAPVLAVPQSLPARAGYVNDYAHVIDGASALEIARIAQRVESHSGGEIVVVTLRSARSEDPLGLATRLARHWELWGEDEAEPSVLILFTLEGDIQAVVSAAAAEFAGGNRIGRILNDRAIPLIEEGEHGRGMVALVRGIAELYAQYFGFQ